MFDIALILKNKTFAMANFAALLIFSSAFAVPFLMSLFLQYIKGMDPKSAGLIILASPITMVIGSPIAGKISDKIEPRIVATIGMIFCSTALLTLSFVITIDTPIYLIMGLLFVFGAGISLFSSPNTNAAMSSVSQRQLGVAASVISTTRIFGQTLSMGISMLVLSLIVGKVEITKEIFPQLMKSIQTTFLVFGILSVIGIFASLTKSKQENKQTS